MAREDLHFRLRIPEDLKARVEDAATKAERSMTAEIIARLQWTFGPAKEEMRALLEQVDTAEQVARLTQKALSDLSHSLRTREQEVDALKHENEKLRKEVMEMHSTVAAQEGVIDELRGLLKASRDTATPDEPIFNIVLDAKGRPLSWPEIAAHIHRTAKAAGVEVASFRAAIFNAEKQDDEAFFGEYARLIRWYQDQTRKHKDKIRGEQK